MNRQLVENILSILKTSTDKSVIVKALVKLRTDVVKDGHGITLFREAGGVLPMVKLLGKPHEQILELALSILGNCCTDTLSCREALDNNISMPLATILKSIPNPCIQCRACRLLGNLAKVDANQLVMVHCPIIAESVCHILEDTSDVQTRFMAFRACRYLLPNTQFLKYFLHSMGLTTLLRVLTAIMKNDAVEEEESLFGQAQIPNTMGLKRNQHREKYFEEVARNLEGVRSDIFDHEVLKNSERTLNAYIMPKERVALDLVCEILKCLLIISEMQISGVIWESLKKANCTFAPIVYFLTQERMKHRSAALKILSNLSKNHGAFYILSSSDAILAACELLVAEDSSKVQALSESERRHCMNIISILSGDACNRSKIRRSGALRKFIKMLKESTSQIEKSSILDVLNNFQYDSMSMDFMLSEGIISVLIKELDIYLSSDEENYKKKRDEKLQSSRKRKITPRFSIPKCKYFKGQDENFMDCDSPSGSPRSNNSPSSPCSSRSKSPFTGFFFNPGGDSDEETYSPVCSDEEDDDEECDKANERDTTSELYNNPNANLNEHAIIMNLLDLVARSDDDSNLLDKEDEEEISQDVPVLKKPHPGNAPHDVIDIIDNLLFRTTCLLKKSSDMGKPETMSTLLKSIRVLGTNTEFVGTLTNILLESQFFGCIIKNGVCHQLYQLTKDNQTRKEGIGFLDTLTSVGESNYGKEELARLLRSDDLYSQQRSAITVAYIIRSRPLLYQFLNDGNALNILLNIILSPCQDELAFEAVDALTCMSHFALQFYEPPFRAEILKQFPEFVLDVDQPLHDNCDIRFMVHAQTGDDDNDENKKNDTMQTTPVSFNKAVLCSSSDVFNAMLNSDFREGNEGEIHLHTCSVTGLRYFLNLLKRRAENLKYNIPAEKQYFALLEAFEMSRIYLIPEIESFVHHVLCQLMDENTCLNVFEWSLQNHDENLTDVCIWYYLSSELSTEAKVKLFRTAEYSKYSTEWFQMLIDTVFTTL